MHAKNSVSIFKKDGQRAHIMSKTVPRATTSTVTMPHTVDPAPIDFTQGILEEDSNQKKAKIDKSGYSCTDNVSPTSNICEGCLAKLSIL